MHTGYWKTSYENGIEKRKNSGKEEVAHSPRLYSKLYSSCYNSGNDLGAFLTIRTAMLFFSFSVVPDTRTLAVVKPLTDILSEMMDSEIARLSYLHVTVMTSM